MAQSEQVDQIYAALAQAQGAMKNAVFNRINPHFKNRYADLAAVIDAIREALSKNGIAVFHTIQPDGAGGQAELHLRTTLGHKSGQWISSLYPLPRGGRPQEFGSALTYAKRYSLTSMVCIAADEDDDAELASKAQPKRENPNVNKPEDFIDKAQYADDGTPIDNIPFGNSELRKLSKKDADIEFQNLRVKMKYQTTREDMLKWGKSVADNVHTLPDLYQVQIREEFADRLSEMP